MTDPKIQPTGEPRITLRKMPPEPGTFEGRIKLLGEFLYSSASALRIGKKPPFFKKPFSLGGNRQIQLELRSGKIFAKDASNLPQKQDIELGALDDFPKFIRGVEDDSPEHDSAEQEIIDILTEKLAPYKVDS